MGLLWHHETTDIADIASVPKVPGKYILKLESTKAACEVDRRRQPVVAVHGLAFSGPVGLWPVAYPWTFKQQLLLPYIPKHLRGEPTGSTRGLCSRPRLRLPPSRRMQ